MMISWCYRYLFRLDSSNRPGSFIVRYNACRSWTRAIIFLVALTSCEIEEKDTPNDAASDAGEVSDSGNIRTTLFCVNHQECSDLLYCNGEEYCSPTSVQANDIGCVAGVTPCLPTQTCQEEEKRCVTECLTQRDADGDGYEAIECGGVDCDDSDASRFPGNEELCDPSHRDEDCDPTTFGERDRDEDGFIDALCCNKDEQGESYCGDDCNDFSAAIHGAQVEICDGIDNNCNGEVDESAAPVNWYPDVDADGFGDPDGESQLSCYPLAGYALLNTDCNDSDASIRPNGDEQCDGVDNDCDGQIDEGLRGLYPEVCDGVEDEDCDGAIDEGCDCVVGTVRACGANQGQRSSGVQVCEAEAVWSFCLGAIGPSSEICDAIDNDCDGQTDNVPGGC